MSLRLYLPSDTTPPISPAFAASSSVAWQTTTGAVRHNMLTAPNGSAFTSITSGSMTASNTALTGQFLSPALAAQTILNSGFVNIQARGLASLASNNVIYLSLRVVTSTGTTRGWLLEAVTASSSIMATTLTNTGSVGNGSSTLVFSAHQASPGNVAVSLGDYLCLEVGGIALASSSTVTFNYGGAAGTDLPNDTTTTAADNPWIEFSQTILFSGGGGATNVGVPPFMMQ